jgi:hypothetical protein
MANKSPKVETFLKETQESQTANGFELTGRIIKKSTSSIEFACIAGTVEIPSKDVADITPIKSKEKSHQGIVQISLRNFSGLQFKFRRPVVTGGFDTSTPTSDYIDTATATWKGSLDATDDVIPISKTDDYIV